MLTNSMNATSLTRIKSHSSLNAASSNEFINWFPRNYNTDNFIAIPAAFDANEHKIYDFLVCIERFFWEQYESIWHNKINILVETSNKKKKQTASSKSFSK